MMSSPKPQSMHHHHHQPTVITQPQPQRLTSTPITDDMLMGALEDLIESGSLDGFLQEHLGLSSLQEHLGIAPGLLSKDDTAIPAKSPATFNRQRRHSIATPGIGELKKCPIPGCGKVFDRAYNLHSHIKVHYSDRPHVCDHCEASFARRHDLKRHAKIHIQEEVKIVCPTCDRTFSRRDALGRHLRLRACRVE